MTRVFLIILTAFALVACKSKEHKVSRSNPEPHWVSSIPTHPDFYVGVYSVKKTGMDYREKAKKGALENIASEISVIISGESVLKTIETTGDFNQEYKQEVVVKSTENIEGYELVGSWENEIEYWVYYRLSKYKYAQIKKERISKALNLAKDFFSRAKENHINNNYHEAFVLCIKALESVSNYLDEPLQTEVDGKKVYFATEVMSYTQEMVNELSIKPSKEDITILLGQTIGEDDVYFNVSNNKGIAISQIPLKCEYKAVFFKTFSVKSDENGKAGVSIGKINQSKEEQFVTANLDFEDLISETTRDKIINNLLSYIPTKTGKLTLHVNAPKIFVEANEMNFGKWTTPTITPSAQQVLSSRGFKVVTNKREADLLIMIKSDSKMVGYNRGTYQVELNGTVEVKDLKTGELVFTEVIESSKGLQLTKEKASIDAYSKAESYVKRRLIPKLANQYFAF